MAGGIHETRVAAGGSVGQGAQHGTLLVGSEATPRARRPPCVYAKPPVQAKPPMWTWLASRQTGPCVRKCCANVLRLLVRANKVVEN